MKTKKRKIRTPRHTFTTDLTPEILELIDLETNETGIPISRLVSERLAESYKIRPRLYQKSSNPRTDP